MGVDEDDFYEAIAERASKRLEKIAESRTKVAYKDFAHSPSGSCHHKAVKNSTQIGYWWLV
jgi:UDP-N-acetylmuramate: L-alanyl-gamma-D-glutamyl-meso-diaminopimelate ligase